MPTPSIHRDHILVGGENRGVQSVALTKTDGTWERKTSVASKRRRAGHEFRCHQWRLAIWVFPLQSRSTLLLGFTQTGKVLWSGPGRAGQNATFLSIPGHIVALMDNGQLQSPWKRPVEDTNQLTTYDRIRHADLGSSRHFAVWHPDQGSREARVLEVSELVAVLSNLSKSPPAK